MIKIKPIIICAATAFVVSFFTALIARTGVPWSLLKALIFAVVFGGLAVGIQIVYEKFLSESNAPMPDISEAPKVVGGKVDLVVSEEDLPNEKDSPVFSLDSARHILTDKDLENSAKAYAAPERPSAPPVTAPTASAAEKKSENENAGASDASAAKPAFVPVGLAGGDGAAQNPPSAPAAAPKAASSSGDALPELDDLPDLGGDKSDDESGSAGGDDGVVEDSEFAQEGAPAPSKPAEFPDGKVADGQDASLMAQAIRTVLAKDDE